MLDKFRFFALGSLLNPGQMSSVGLPSSLNVYKYRVSGHMPRFERITHSVDLVYFALAR